jgi:GT2 family glycosyltransferase
MTKKDPFISIIIVTYNGADYIINCLRSVKEQLYDKRSVEIIAVDNASKDKTPEIIENTFRDVYIIRNKKNIGFGRANNIGIKKSKGEYVVLLNQDSLVDKNWLSVLIKTMEENHNAGCCGAEEYSYDMYGKITKAAKRVKKCLWMGCGSIIFRKKALDEVGLFDPYYFMYMEDVDLVWRIKAKGWKILQNYQALWFHKGKERRVDLSEKRLFWSWKNRLYLIMKFGSNIQILKSMITYLTSFLRKKKKGEPESEESHTKEELRETKYSSFWKKIFFIIKLIVIIPPLVIFALVARYELRKKIGINQKEIDEWIAYTDKVFYRDL